jgi:hypothetical protein
MSDESFWVERAQSAEAKLSSLKQASEQALERIKNFKANFGVKERANGEIDIDFPKFVERLGEASAIELRRIIDERYRSGGG